MRILPTESLPRKDKEEDAPMFDDIVDGESAAVTACPPHGTPGLIMKS